MTVRKFENCTVRQKAIRDGIGDCRQEKNGGCRGYASMTRHDEPYGPCRKCQAYYLHAESGRMDGVDREITGKRGRKFPGELLADWDNMRAAARMISKGDGRIVVGMVRGKRRRYVKPN